MGKLLDDLNRLSAVSAQGNVLKPPGRGGSSCSQPAARSNVSEGSTYAPPASWASFSGVSKTKLVPQHASCDFVTRHYEVVRELGRGSFSHVKLVRERHTGHERVCKVVRTEQMSPEVLQLAKTEVQVLAALDHPHIVKLYEFAEDPARNKLVLILEYIGGGDCSGLLQGSGRSLSEPRVARLLYQLMVAVNCCHSRGVVHRDLKPQNMMLTRTVGAWGTPSLKVIDFGLAACMQSSRDFVGTPAYMPPEVLAGTVDYTSMADIWSIGVTAIELLAGEPPFGKPEDYNGDMQRVFANIRSFRSFEDITDKLEELPSWAGRSNEAKDFVRRLLRLDPERRPTAAEALCHPFLESCREAQYGLGADMLRSMASYATAPALVRCCMLAIAARTGVSEAARVGAAFADVDSDDDGVLSPEELVHAIAGASTCGWGQSEVDAAEVFAAADLGHTGFLAYTEFAAAVLFSRYSSSIERLAKEAFAAFDSDRDGWVQMGDIWPLLCYEARSSLMDLSEDRAVSAEDWALCVRTVARSFAESPELRKNSRHSRSRELPYLEEESGNHLLGQIKEFLFDRLLCSTCEQFRDDDETNVRWNSPVVVSNRYDPNHEVPVGYELPDPLRIV